MVKARNEIHRAEKVGDGNLFMASHKLSQRVIDRVFLGLEAADALRLAKKLVVYL
jgi:hypothetical protein